MQCNGLMGQWAGSIMLGVLQGAIFFFFHHPFLFGGVVQEIASCQ